MEFENIMADFGDRTTPLAFMSSVSPDKTTNDEGTQCDERTKTFVVSVYSRRDLYEAIRAAVPRNKAQSRLYAETLKEFRKNGLDHSDEKLAKVNELKQRLAVLESRFASNLKADTSAVEYSPAELTGLPPDFLGRLQKSASGRLLVTTKESDYVQLMENASLPESRRRMLLAFSNRAADRNVGLLEEAIVLRERIAVLLGYRSWADYRIETDHRMATDARSVLEFLSGLKGKLGKRCRQDLARLLAFKKERFGRAEGVLHAWDITYLEYQLKMREYALDDERIREYFPADVVVKGMFDVYSRLFGVRFEQVPGAPVWSPLVKFYEIHDGGTGELIGSFYTDFVPRPLKYEHAAAFPLLSGREASSGYQKPVAAIVANFNPPSGDKPSLLNHEEVETIFHEFGHIMHMTLTRAPFASLSGSDVASDFVEAPSQMLENWVWSPEVLASISGHYLDPSRKLPEALRRKMIAARDFDQGYFYTRQLMLGLTDMAYHAATGPVDTTAVYEKLYREILGVQPIAGGHFAGTFGHLMGGYDAGYYGYLWSEVYALDMFSEFEKAGLLNAAVGARYRRWILEQGDMQDAVDLVRGFLEREPSPDAFYRRLHIPNGPKGP